MATETGPRRAHREPLLEAVPPQTPLYRAVANAAAAKLSVATSSINLFSRPVVDSSPDTLRRGRCKSWIFLALMFVLADSLLAWYVATPSLQTVSIKNPTIDDVYDNAQFAPQCACTTPTQSLGDAVWLNTSQPLLQLNSNVCGTILEIARLCGGTYFPSGPVNCTQTLGGALLMHGLLGYLGVVCSTYARELTVQTDTILSTALGMNLLMPEELERLANATARQRMAQFADDAAIALAPVDAAMTLPLATRIDLSEGSPTQAPPGCSCRYEFMSGALGQTNTPCRFRAAFDSRSTQQGDTWWDCSYGSAALNFPLALFTANATYDHLSMPVAYRAGLMSFVGADSINENSTVQAFLEDIAWQIFPPIIVNGTAEGVDFENLQPGFMQVDYSGHFARCNPAICTYEYRGRPSFIGALTTALGIISGLQTLLSLVVDKGYDWAVKAKPIATDAAAAADGGGGAGGGEGSDHAADVAPVAVVAVAAGPAHSGAPVVADTTATASGAASGGGVRITSPGHRPLPPTPPPATFTLGRQ